jgi:cytochrome bd-type quinol oxidase subunit 2
MLRKQTVTRLFVASTWALTLCQLALPVLADGGPGGPAEGLANLVKMAVDGLIVLAGLAMAFAIAFTGATSVFAKMAGMPYAEANATMKIIGVVLLFILTVFAIPLANAVIDAVMQYHSAEGIHIPGS